MSGYERFALILDSETAELGEAAVRLVELGVDVLYAKHADEAILLARQEASRLGAILVPASLALAAEPGLLRRLCAGLDAGHGSLVAVGDEPEAEGLASLQRQAVQWCLWAPYDERELRFVLGAAMSLEHPNERRRHLRVPTDIETTVFMGRHRKSCRIHDLSVSGAYLAAPDPFLAGSRLSIDLGLPGGAVLGKALVVRDKTAEAEARADVPDGMGIAFSELAPGSEQCLAAFVRERIRRFQLGV
jgi:hypothetical protein